MINIKYKYFKLICQNPKSTFTWKSWTNKCFKSTHINLQSFFQFFLIEIENLTTPYISTIVFKIYSIPSLCNDMATIFSTKNVFFHIYILPLYVWIQFLTQKWNVTCHISILCLNIFFVKELNKDIKPN